MQAISAADANRHFSRVLRRVREGRSYTVTSHGRAVARILPFRTEHEITTAARTALFKRLRASRVRVVGPWTREELYEDG